jgi:hypothetical protein
MFKPEAYVDSVLDLLDDEQTLVAENIIKNPLDMQERYMSLVPDGLLDFIVKQWRPGMTSDQADKIFRKYSSFNQGGRIGYKKPGKVNLLTKDELLDFLEKKDIKIGTLREYNPGYVKQVLDRYGIQTVKEEGITKFSEPNDDMLKDMKERMGKFSGIKYEKAKTILEDSKLREEFIKYANKPEVTTQDIRNKYNLGREEFYESGLRDILDKDFQKQQVTKLRKNTVDNILKLVENEESFSFLKKGELVPEEVLTRLGININEAATATTRLAQIYGGHKFNESRLKNIKYTPGRSDKLFSMIEKSVFGNPYRGILYKISLDTIDNSLGNEKGTFASLKRQASEILRKNKIKGFDINEIVGVTGSAKTGVGEFSQFIDVLDSNLNQKELASFQSAFSRARQNIMKNPSSVVEESRRINKLARSFEERYGVKLPKIRPVGNVENYYSPKRLADLKNEGIDIVEASNKLGYTIEMPKGAMTIQEFLKPENVEMFLNPKNKKISGGKGLTVKQFKQMGYRCNKSGGGEEDVACYMKDVIQTKEDLKSNDPIIRAKALTKQRKAANAAKKIPELFSLFRKGLQGTLGTIGGPAGAVVEGLVEAGTYDYFSRKGYTDKQAAAETFFAKTFGLGDLKEGEGRGLFEDATKLIEKEIAGKDPAKLRYLDNLKKQEEIYNEIASLEAASSGEQYLKPEQSEDLKNKLKLKLTELTKLENKIKPGSPDYETWKEAEERQQNKAGIRAEEYKKESRLFPETEEESEKRMSILNAPKRLQEQRKYLTGTIEPGAERIPSMLQFEPGELDEMAGDLNKWELIYDVGGLDLLDKIGIAGGVSKMASGGIASLTTTIPPKRGPNSQGLASLKKYGKQY